jgi:hypothetical protein
MSTQHESVLFSPQAWSNRAETKRKETGKARTSSKAPEITRTSAPGQEENHEYKINLRDPVTGEEIRTP